MTSFDTLGLSPELLRAVADEAYTTPTPIQAQAIPLVLAGRDVLAAAQTGTGKTAAFVLPILERLRGGSNVSYSPARHPVRALVLAPTRELAVQVGAMTTAYGRHLALRSAVVHGGIPVGPQVKELLRGVEILVATPGRLLDLVGQRAVSLGRVEVLVLDEADRMLDMGFMPDIDRIMALLPPRRQTLLFSATLDGDVRRLAETFMHAPATVEVAPPNRPAEAVREVLYPVDRERKLALLEHLLRRHDVRQALVFTRTKLAASRLAADLDRDGFRAVAIHSDRAQADRTRALADFRAGRIDILVATDVASRGLDIEELPLVVNFELPMKPEDYVHRVGRTGRAGSAGVAISLACVDEVDLLRAIQGLLRRAIPWQVEPGFVPDRNAEPRPIRGLGGRGRGPSGGGRSPEPAHVHKSDRLHPGSAPARHRSRGPSSRPA
ncbi:MAG: DEAD/DEAH box helicase [Chloroflexi bacterium]|nr:DEAD/DEAH box helicase [Chloroflexota bacterium]